MDGQNKPDNLARDWADTMWLACWLLHGACLVACLLIGILVGVLVAWGLGLPVPGGTP